MEAELALGNQRSTAAKGEEGTRRLSVTEAAEQFASGSALADGQVNLVSLDPIRARLAERWPSRRDQVYDHVEKVLQRNLGPTAYILRVSDIDFLVAQPELGPFAAQTGCLRSLTELLRHFLGEANRRDLLVHRVTNLAGGVVTAVQIDPAAAAAGARKEAEAAAEAARRSVRSSSTLLSPERWSPFVAGNGKKVRVSCQLEPVFELRGNTRIGYRLHRRVLDAVTERELTPQEISNMGRADLLRIDMATIARGMARLQSSTNAELELSLILPISHVSLSYQEGRSLLAAACSEVRQSVLKGVICEICDIDDVPQVALTTAVAYVKPWSILVIGHLTGEPPRASPDMRDAGLQAMSITSPSQIMGDVEFAGWLRDSLRSTQKVSRATLVYGCTSTRRVGMAGLMGASHASIRGAYIAGEEPASAA